MKPGASAASIGVLPRSAHSFDATAIDSGDVASPRIISTSGISGTGFMKCIPSTLSGRLVAAPRSVMEMDEVFDARITSGRVTASRLVKSARFVSALSTIASTT